MADIDPRQKARKKPCIERFLLWQRILKNQLHPADNPPDIPVPELLGLTGNEAPRQHGLISPFAAEAELLGYPLSEPLKKAFQTFGLDPGRPLAWRLLLYIFADTHFGSHPSRRGAPKKWTNRRWCDLLSDLNQLHTRYSKKSEAELCGLLKTNSAFRTRYEDVGDASTIRRNLAYARDPKRNGTLKELSYLCAGMELRNYTEITPALEAKIRRNAVGKALMMISTYWQRRANNSG
jgi:hypothetical protein